MLIYLQSVLYAIHILVVRQANSEKMANFYWLPNGVIQLQPVIFLDLFACQNFTNKAV